MPQGLQKTPRHRRPRWVVGARRRRESSPHVKGCRKRGHFGRANAPRDTSVSSKCECEAVLLLVLGTTQDGKARWDARPINRIHVDEKCDLRIECGGDKRRTA